MTKKRLMKGNEAVVRGAIGAGCKFYAGYPITPQNAIGEHMSKLMPEAGGTFIQAEAELSAINMLFGASSTGIRCMTSSSSPGIALKQEGISYIAGAELPCVIVNMQRGGPGLGNIRASQADYFQSVKGGGHGDYNLIVLAPSDVQEVYDLTMGAFDYADHFRNPVLILGDGILAQMAEPVVMKEYEPILDLPDKSGWILNGCEGREPHVVKTLHLRPDNALEKHNVHLQKKYKIIEKELSLVEEFETEDSELIIVAYGITARIAKEAVKLLREEDIKVGLVRPITLWPFPKKTIQKYKDKKVLVVEMSQGQMIEDVKLSLLRDDIEFLGRGGGWYPDTEKISRKVKEIL